ncbi:alpha/beta hydrolase [Actinoplanes aureus]|uniref:alpha/beta hydrolase n=1 Tax=Actinoplanes aureus TaxID=2792083 RepID=UPI001E2D885D|nr:esterase [Actinoplanes aureus]
MAGAGGARWEGATLSFRYADATHTLCGARVLSSAFKADLAFHDGFWELSRETPPVQRLEYRLELLHRDGSRETVCDPANPDRVPGGFGESSVLHSPDYREPAWLHLPPAPGSWRTVRLPVRGLRTALSLRIWSPETPTTRVLLAHDGPDYDRFGDLGRYTAAMIGDGRVAPYHLVLLPAGDRLEWYSASRAYALALAGEVLPRVRAGLASAAAQQSARLDSAAQQSAQLDSAAQQSAQLDSAAQESARLNHTGPPGGTVVGAGASLGALAMLHAQRRHPAGFAGLFLQSGSFFQPRYDSQESGFQHWKRIVRFTTRTLRARRGPAVPAAITCGAAEENLANNRDMADALAKQGYPVTTTENPDAHTWVGWRDALDPHLTSLLRQVWPN